jgi:hypothetical protein
MDNGEYISNVFRFNLLSPFTNYRMAGAIGVQLVYKLFSSLHYLQTLSASTLDTLITQVPHGRITIRASNLGTS